MLFHSFDFQLMMIIAAMLFYLMPNKRIAILAITNIVFYSASGLNFLVLFISMAYITFYCAKKSIGKNGKAFLIIGVMLNLLNLGFFKYTGFILENISNSLGLVFPWQDTLLAKIILPIGISFYTFQLIAYVVDVYHKKVEPETSFIKFWVFISFFGQLIAGPIMRGNEFLPQINNIKNSRFQIRNIKYAAYFMSMGLVKKVVFADNLSKMANTYFAQGTAMGSFDAWIAAYLFAFQIYFDFSAYSEMAVGAGHLFGLDLNLNFKTPYLSKSPSEFWKRWHITLSSWIKDYIYIPLGGNSKGFILQNIFLLIAMTLSGLWHGAAWTFIAWGVFHGILVGIHKIYDKSTKGLKIRKSLIYKGFATIVFFQITTIGWVFFRATSISNALDMINKMIFLDTLNPSKEQVMVLAVIVMLFVLHILEYYIRNNEVQFFNFYQNRVPVFVRSMIFVAVFMIIILFIKTEQSSFIYFQF